MKAVFVCPEHGVRLTITKDASDHEVRVIQSGGRSAACILSHGHKIDHLLSYAEGKVKPRHFVRKIRSDGHPEMATERIQLLEQEGVVPGGLA